MFKAIGRALKKTVTAPVAFVRNTKKLLAARREAEDIWEIAEEAEADPRLYGDAHWRARLMKETGDLISVLPLHAGVKAIMQSLLTNWKTTLIGVGTGFGYFFFQALQGGATLKDAAFGAGLALLGLMAKDANVTGGTKPATPEATDRVEK